MNPTASLHVAGGLCAFDVDVCSVTSLLGSAGPPEPEHDGDVAAVDEAIPIQVLRAPAVAGAPERKHACEVLAIDQAILGEVRRARRTGAGGEADVPALDRAEEADEALSGKEGTIL